MLSAVAATAGGASLAGGYRDGFLVAGLAALTMAAIASVALPAVRPAAGVRVGVH